MDSLDSIKRKISYLYKNHPEIHVNISLGRPKISLQNDPAKIVGIYPNVFIIEESSSGSVKSHTLQYIDVLTKQIEIVELNG